MDVHVEVCRTLSPTEYGPEAMLASYSGDIVRSEDSRKIGRVRAFVADIERAREHGYGALDFLDVDGAVWPYNVLLSRREAGSFTAAVNRILGVEEVYSQNLLIIDRVEVLPRYRGHDFGLQAMHLILAHLALGCRLAAIKPYPLQFEAGDPLGEPHAWREQLRLEKFSPNQVAATKRLQRHYARLGFVSVKGTGLMIRDLDEGYTAPWTDAKLPTEA